MLYIVSWVFRHAAFISSRHSYVWAIENRLGQYCILHERPDFGLNMKFQWISCCISFYRFLGLLISIQVFNFVWLCSKSFVNFWWEVFEIQGGWHSGLSGGRPGKFLILGFESLIFIYISMLKKCGHFLMNSSRDTGGGFRSPPPHVVRIFWFRTEEG